MLESVIEQSRSLSNFPCPDEERLMPTCASMHRSRIALLQIEVPIIRTKEVIMSIVPLYYLLTNFDLLTEYLEISLDEQSKDLTVVSTPLGHFTRKMPFVI